MGCCLTHVKITLILVRGEVEEENRVSLLISDSVGWSTSWTPDGIQSVVTSLFSIADRLFALPNKYCVWIQPTLKTGSRSAAVRKALTDSEFFLISKAL